MNALPKGWAEITLGDAGEWRGGGTPSKANPQFWSNGDIPWVSPKDMKSDLIADAEDHITREAVDGSATQLIPEKSILLVTRSGILRHTLPVVLTTRQVAINQDLKALTPNGAVDPEFVSHQIRSSGRVILAACAKSGTTVDSIDFERLKTTRLFLPPLSEQRRIVTKIDSLTGKSRRARDHLDHIPRLVEKYKQAVLAAAFRGDLTEGKCALAPLEEFVLALDQGWSPKCEPEPAASGEWAVIKTTAIQPVKFIAGENKRLPSHLSPRPEIAIRAGDVLITRAGPRSRVAISCVVAEDHPRLMLCDKAYRLRVDQHHTDPMYLTYMLNSPQCLSALEGMKTGISDSGLNLTQGKFLELPIPAFSKDIQVRIVDKVRIALNWIDRLASETTSARRLIDRLDQAVLAKAFRGELVPQDPADEPASVLLDRTTAEREAAPKARRGRKAKIV